MTDIKLMENKDIDKAARKHSILRPFQIKKFMDILTDLSEPNPNAPCYTARMILDNDFEMIAEALSESMSFPDYNTVGLSELRRLKEETLSGNEDGFTDGFYSAWKFLEKHVDSRQSEIDELIEALEEATRWIPVSEDLPRPNEPILIYRPQHFVIDGFWGYGEDGGYFMSFHEPGKITGITHWRPIDTPKATQLLERYRKK